MANMNKPNKLHSQALATQAILVSLLCFKKSTGDEQSSENLPVRGSNE